MMAQGSVLLLVWAVVTRLACLAISWYAELSRERTRAKTLMALVCAAGPGATVVMKSADGTTMIVMGHAPLALPASTGEGMR
jgi:hypothetical protein